LIEVDNLSFTYAGGKRPAAQGLRFEIEDGEVFGFLGPSGAGKTTTQNILIGLLKGYHGRVNVMGRELGEWGLDYYERIGVSFEFPNHYLKLTARENLEYFRSLYTGETDDPAELLQTVGLGEDMDVRVSQYSKGMKNRLNFARSLLHRPRLWFLDEPTTGLDPANSKNIRNIVKERQARGVTTFLTTHDMMVADELCDRVGFIVDGELKIIDSPKALKRRYGTRTVKVELQSDDGAGPREFALDGLGEDKDFLRLIREHRVEAIHSQETTLEKVFLEITGRALA
jgi:fluoroquinolone transport system ATP-binding protein